MSAATGRDRWAVPLAGLVILAAAALRVFHIDNQSAWVDEAFTVHASAQPWDGMMRILVADFNHPPLHTMLVRWWGDVFGVGVVQARVLSAIFGTAAVAAVYWLGALLFDRRTALLASALMAVSQLGIMYSQEARGYSLLLLMVVVSTALFVRAFQGGRRRDVVFFALAAGVALNTHYYAGFALAAVFVFALVFRRASAVPLHWWIGAAFAIAILFVPWLASGVVESFRRNPQGAANPQLFAQLAAPLYALNWFNNGKLAGLREQAPAWTFAAGMLLTMPALYGLTRLLRGSAQERRAGWLLARAVGVPIAAAGSRGLARVIYDVRHVSFAVPAYYLLVARGIMTLSSPAWRRGLTIAVFAYSTLSFRADFFVPYKDNYRDAVGLVAAGMRPGDCSVLAAPDGLNNAEWYWTSYHHGLAFPPIVTPAEAGSRDACRRAWLLWDKSWWKKGPQTYDAAHDALRASYQPRDRHRFSGMDVQLFER